MNETGKGGGVRVNCRARVNEKDGTRPRHLAAQSIVLQQDGNEGSASLDGLRDGARQLVAGHVEHLQWTRVGPRSSVGQRVLTWRSLVLEASSTVAKGDGGIMASSNHASPLKQSRLPLKQSRLPPTSVGTREAKARRMVVGVAVRVGAAACAKGSPAATCTLRDRKGLGRRASSREGRGA